MTARPRGAGAGAGGGVGEGAGPGEGARVTALSITPIKGTRLQQVQSIHLGRRGVRENRRFFLIDDRDRMVNGKPLGELQRLVAGYTDRERRLEIAFPDGQVISGPVELGETVRTRFFSRTVDASLVLGDWSGAISDHLGQPLRLVEADEDGAVDRGRRGPVTLISQASLGRLADEGALSAIDARRFRMLIEIDGVDAHAEDAWVGRQVRAGEATVRPAGHVGRCLITSRDPESGEVDTPTLEILGDYRRAVETSEPLPFGIYGDVVEPGVIRVGDPVSLAGG